MKSNAMILLLFVFSLISLTACQKNQSANTNLEVRDQLFQSRLNAVRLGDGVPLDLDIAIRWKIDALVTFHTQFAHPRAFDKVGLDKELEIAKICAENPTYASYMVNKELTSKVQIAVLPANVEGNIFGELLKMQTPAQTAKSKEN